MKLLHEIKLGVWDILNYVCLTVCGFFRLLLVFGVIPTLPLRTRHNRESLKKALQIGARINFMINATRFGLQERAQDLELVQNRLKNIFAFREGYSFGLRMRDYRLLKLLDSESPMPFQMYFVLSEWDIDTKYPKWADLPVEIRNRLSREMSSNFVVFDL